MRLKYEISSKDKMSIDKDLYSDKFVIELNNNKPVFTEEDEKRLESSDDPFTELDEGRCGVAFANINRSTLTSGHDKIQSKPLGFPDSKEKNEVNNRFIFQRCHLIAYHLFKIKNNKEKNANLKRIFTGTRFMNNEMSYYEKRIAQYVKKDNKRKVIYRVTPYYKCKDMVVCGVKMEAKFINENGNEDKKLSFNVFIYNKQPDILFKYGTGKILKNESMNLSEKMSKIDRYYIINKRSKRFHLKCCASVRFIDKDRRIEFRGKRGEINDNNIGFKCIPCEICDSGIK